MKEILQFETIASELPNRSTFYFYSFVSINWFNVFESESHNTKMIEWLENNMKTE